MEDQVVYLNKVGIKSTAFSLAIAEEDKKKIEKGEFSIVYGSPESWMMERWRKMLKGTIYNQKVCCVAVDEAHVISHFGIFLLGYSILMNTFVS